MPARDRVGQRSLVWDTHQPGWAAAIRAAAASRSASVSNRPKQVAPEPDMRAMRAPDSASQHVADLGHQRAARAPRGRCGPPPNRRAGPRSTPSQAANTAAVESGTPGLTSSTGVPGQAVDLDRLDRVAPALAARGAAEQAGGHVGAERRGDLHRPAEHAQHGRRVGRAAAEPGRDRQPLVERQRGRAADRAGRLQHQIVRRIAERAGERARSPSGSARPPRPRSARRHPRKRRRSSRSGDSRPPPAPARAARG